VASLVSVKRLASQSFGAWTGLLPMILRWPFATLAVMRSTRWIGSCP